MTVVLIVVIGTGVHVGAIEIQIVGIVVAVGRRGPIVAVAAPIVSRGTIEVPGVDEIRSTRLTIVKNTYIDKLLIPVGTRNSLVN